MSLQDEHDLPDIDLKHDPVRGGRKWDGLAVNGDTEHPDTQVPADKLVTRNYTNAGYQIEPPFFFCPPTSHTWHEGMPSFLTGGGEIEMRLLRWEVPRLSACQEVRAKM